MSSYPIRAEWSNRPGWSGFHTPRPGNSDNLHHGFDYYCPEGTPIYAAGPGVVKSRGSGFGPNSFGNNTTIWYDGSPIVAATYAHMNASPLIPVGGRVTADTIIGYVGHTGNAADVIWNGLRHVHEEILINGRYVDPIAFHGPVVAAGSAAPVAVKPPQKREEIMAVRVRRKSTNRTYLISSEHIHDLNVDDANYKAGTDQYGDIQTLDDAPFHALCDANGIPWGAIPRIAAGGGWSSTKPGNYYKEAW